MSDETGNRPPNAPGKYYVVQEYCLHHCCCVDISPGNFTVNGPYEARVYKQPETPAEEQKCREAMECCPVGAIVDDGV